MSFKGYVKKAHTSYSSWKAKAPERRARRLEREKYEVETARLRATKRGYESRNKAHHKGFFSDVGSIGGGSANLIGSTGLNMGSSDSGLGSGNYGLGGYGLGSSRRKVRHHKRKAVVHRRVKRHKSRSSGGRTIIIRG
jgi:hypothetical protein